MGKLGVRRSGLIWLAGLIVASLLSACGGSDGDDGNGGPTVAVAAAPPGITTQPQDANVLPGSGAGFSIAASGTAPLSYQWQRNGADIAGATGSTLTIAAAAPNDDGAQLRVVVRNAAGSVTSRTATLSVGAVAALAIVAQPAPLRVAVGQGATFNVFATGSAPFSYQWLRNGTPIDGATTSAFSIAAVARGDDGAGFSVRVGSGAAQVTSSTALLTVMPAQGGLAAEGLAAGYDVSFAIRDDGSVLQLSSELPWTRVPTSAVANSSARRLDGLSAAAIDVGGLYALAVGGDGLLYGWGINANGRLGGTEGNGNVNAPRAVGGVSSVKQGLATDGYALALRDDGTVWHWPGVIRFASGGTAASEPRSIEGLTGVASLASLSGDINGTRLRPAAIKSDGTVWELRWDVQTVTGTGGPVQTYTGGARQIDGLSDVARIRCNYSHCLALTRAGTVLAWGGNGFGQLGNGSTSSTVVATPAPVPGLTNVRNLAVAGAASMALTADGRLLTWGIHDTNGHGGNSDLPVPTVLTFRSPVVQIAGGWQHASVRLDDGSLWGWGANQGMQLGDGGMQTRATPVQAAGVTLN